MAIDRGTVYRILGDETLRELKPEREWSLEDGVTTNRRFVGPAPVIEAYFNELSAQGVFSGADGMSESYKGQSGMLILRVVDDSGGTEGGNTEELNAIWELIGRPILLPIENHRDFDAISARDKRFIEKTARDGDELGGGDPTEEKLYAYYAHNVLDFLSTDLMLTKTTTVSSRTVITAVYTDLNKVVTIATIDPPTAIIGALTSLPKLGTADGAWEWLKLSPQVRQVTKIKYQLSYQWHGASRWADIYGGSWSPKFD